MGKINRCLKYVFLFFNGLFAGLGALMITGLMKASAYNNQVTAAGGPSQVWSWIFAIGVLLIAILGIYAGRSEKELPLKIFAGFMGVGMVIMLIGGIAMAVMRNKIKDTLAGTSTSTEDIQPYLKEEELKTLLGEIQSTYSCCGVVSASDWGDNIPDSCRCSSFTFRPDSKCQSKPEGVSGPSMIYRRTCGTHIFDLFDWAFQVSIGMLFGFAVTALMGLLLSLLMIHQVKRCDSVGGGMAMKGY